MNLRRETRTLAPLVLCLAALVGCGSDSTGTADQVATRSADHFYSIVHETLWQDDALHAANLLQALPNRTIWSESQKAGRAESQFSDAIVAGKVVKVEPLRARIWNEDESYARVDFDDPRADGRSVSVTVEVTDTLGVQADDGLFTFTVGVLGSGNKDPQAYMASLRGLGDVAVVLERYDNGADPVEYSPAAGTTLIGQVGKDGGLSFPAYGEHEEEFVQGIETLDDLLAEAEKPTVMIHLDTEYVSPTSGDHDH